MAEGDYLRLKNQDRFENVFRNQTNNLKGFNLKTLLVLVAIKMKIVLDLKNYGSLMAFEDEMRKSKEGYAKKLMDKKNRMVLHKIREMVIGKADLKARDAARFIR